MVRDAYLEPSAAEAARRFAGSGEFAELMRLVGDRVRGGVVVDVGAGRGIASYAFAQAGARLVHAVEPDPSADIGRGAISTLPGESSIDVLDGVAESIPLADDSVDLYYGRQVLHHVSDLEQAMREAARVLRPGAALLVCREHVVDNRRQLDEFLREHPMHQLAGNENAFPLESYRRAITTAGLSLRAEIGPFDSVLNAYPLVQSGAELDELARALLIDRLGRAGAALSRLPGVESAVWARLRRPRPGRLYSFFAVAPG